LNATGFSFAQAEPGKKRPRDDKADEAEAEEEVAKEPFEVETKGLIVHFKFVDEIDGEITRELVRETVGDESKIVFVKYSKGQKEGFLRYVSAEIAKEAVDALGDTRELKIAGKTALVTLLEGEAEAAYWEAVRDVLEKFELLACLRVMLTDLAMLCCSRRRIKQRWTSVRG
jgi:hypothetical protein